MPRLGGMVDFTDSAYQDYRMASGIGQDIGSAFAARRNKKKVEEEKGIQDEMDAVFTGIVATAHRENKGYDYILTESAKVKDIAKSRYYQKTVESALSSLGGQQNTENKMDILQNGLKMTLDDFGRPIEGQEDIRKWYMDQINAIMTGGGTDQEEAPNLEQLADMGYKAMFGEETPKKPVQPEVQETPAEEPSIWEKTKNFLGLGEDNSVENAHQQYGEQKPEINPQAPWYVRAAAGIPDLPNPLGAAYNAITGKGKGKGKTDETIGQVTGEIEGWDGEIPDWEMKDVVGEPTKYNIQGEKYYGGASPTGKPPEFIQRMSDDSPVIKNEDGSVSSHLMMHDEMSDGRWVSFPSIVNINGKLTKLTPQQAVEYAQKNKEYLIFDTEKEAEAFSKGSWKKNGTPQGQPQETINGIPTAEYDKRIAGIKGSVPGVGTPEFLAEMEKLSPEKRKVKPETIKAFIDDAKRRMPNATPQQWAEEAKRMAKRNGWIIE